MRILLSHRFFWPDSPPYAAMLRALGAELASRGHEVGVFSAQPSYRPDTAPGRQPAKEDLDGIRVQRMSILPERRKDTLVRSMNATLYSLRLSLRILFGRRADLVVTSTFPPILAALCAALACRLRGIAFVYHCMDIHPEVSLVHRKARPGMFFGVLRRFDSLTCRLASVVVVLSEDMRRTMLDRPGARSANVRVINNFDLPTYDSSDEAGESVGSLLKPHRFTLLFAGNLGRFQGLDTVIRAAAELRDLPNFEIVLMGDGVMLPELRQLAEELDCRNLRFLPFQAPSSARRLIGQADFGLVTLQEGMYRVAYPSKTMTYLAEGCPVLALVEPDSELAAEIVGQRLGLVAANTGGVADLRDCLRRAWDEREQWRRARQRIRHHAREQFSFAAAMTRWNDLLAELD